MALVDYFLKIDGVEGESVDAKHKNEFDVESYSWGETVSVAFGSGSGATVGKVQSQDFTFVKRVDKGSPELFIGCATGSHYKSAILTGRKSGGNNPDTLKITMEDVLLTAYHQSGQSGDAPPKDQVSLMFAKLEISYTPMKPDGSLAAEVKQKYDFAANKKL